MRAMQTEHLKGTGAGEGNRTLVVSLEGFCSTIELHPRVSFTSCYSVCLAKTWWRGLDSNQRTHSEQIYSLPPLTTRPPLREEPQSMKQLLTTVNRVRCCCCRVRRSWLLRGVIISLGSANPQGSARKFLKSFSYGVLQGKPAKVLPASPGVSGWRCRDSGPPAPAP
jgi:hypothetical protein